MKLPEFVHVPEKKKSKQLYQTNRISFFFSHFDHTMYSEQPNKLYEVQRRIKTSASLLCM